MYTSQAELLTAKNELHDLIAATKSAIGKTAVQHFAALEDKFSSCEITKEPLYSQQRGILRRNRFTRSIEDRIKPVPPMNTSFGLQRVETIAERRLLASRSAGKLALMQPAVNRTVKLHYGPRLLTPRHAIEISQQGAANTTGFITRPRREEGDLTTQTLSPTEAYQGYEDAADLHHDYSRAYRGALSTALTVNQQLNREYDMPVETSDELNELMGAWSDVDPYPIVSEEHILHHLKLRADY